MEEKKEPPQKSSEIASILAAMKKEDVKAGEPSKDAPKPKEANPLKNLKNILLAAEENNVSAQPPARASDAKTPLLETTPQKTLQLKPLSLKQEPVSGTDESGESVVIPTTIKPSDIFASPVIKKLNQLISACKSGS